MARCTASPWGAPFRDQKYGQCAGFPRCAPASTEIDSAEKCKAKCLSTRVQESAGQDYVNASLVHACDAITFRKWSNGTAVCTLFSGCVAGKPTKKEQPYVFYDSAGRGVVNNETLISYMLSDCPATTQLAAQLAGCCWCCAVHFAQRVALITSLLSPRRRDSSTFRRG